MCLVLFLLSLQELILLWILVKKMLAQPNSIRLKVIEKDVLQRIFGKGHLYKKGRSLARA